MKTTSEHLIDKEKKGYDKAEYRRLAGRTKEQFAEDIKKGHRIEREIIERYAKYYKDRTSHALKIVDNGVDNTGELLDIKDVNHSADFLVNGKPLEVKFIKDNLFQFRLKLNLLKGYIEQNASVLIVLGWETDAPEFTIWNKERLEHIVKYGKKVVSGDWEGKPTVLIYRNSYRWTELPKL